MTDLSPRRGVGFWIAVLVGWGGILFGAIGYLNLRGSADAIAVATWVVGGNLVHDAVIVPIALVIGAVLGRFVPEPWRDRKSVV